MVFVKPANDKGIDRNSIVAPNISVSSEVMSFLHLDPVWLIVRGDYLNIFCLISKDISSFSFTVVFSTFVIKLSTDFFVSRV